MSVTLAKLASLDLLRGFVAVGRRMSITLAAQDLFLTQSAVSRQIHTLEESLGVALFRRGHRAIAFTPEGERLFRSADSVMQQLQDAIGALHDGLRQRPVTLTSGIGFVGLWLLPRLGNFQSQHPEVEVRLSANNDVNDLRKEGLDIAIRYCAQTAMPAGAVRLFSETITPVAQPALALSRLSADTIAQSVLLEFDGHYRPWWSWQVWLESQGWASVKPKAILRFNQYDQMIHAAIAGQGIALGRRELITHLIADGRLMPLATAQPGPASTHVFCLIQADSEPRRETQLVIDWIMAEAALTAAAGGTTSPGALPGT
jgi:DNA-binding transcriptional LysR family regulator